MSQSQFPSNIHFQSLTPTLSVTCFNRLDEFYTVLGFKRDWIWPEESPTHVSYSLNDTSIMFALKKDQSHLNICDIYFTITGVRSIHEYYSDLNLKVSPLINSEYGMLDFSLLDPWGHHLVFGEIVTSD